MLNDKDRRQYEEQVLIPHIDRNRKNPLVIDAISGKRGFSQQVMHFYSEDNKESNAVPLDLLLLVQGGSQMYNHLLRMYFLLRLLL